MLVLAVIKNTAKITLTTYRAGPSLYGALNIDPMPTQLVLSCLDSLLPVLTRIINLSLKSGVFATDWKEALILPLIKKENLDCTNLQNFRQLVISSTYKS